MSVTSRVCKLHLTVGFGILMSCSNKSIAIGATDTEQQLDVRPIVRLRASTDDNMEKKLLNYLVDQRGYPRINQLPFRGYDPQNPPALDYIEINIDPTNAAYEANWGINLEASRLLIMPGTSLPKANLTGSSIGNIMFDELDLSGGNFSNSKINKFIDVGSNLTNLDLSKSILGEVNISGKTRLDGALLEESILGNSRTSSTLSNVYKSSNDNAVKYNNLKLLAQKSIWKNFYIFATFSPESNFVNSKWYDTIMYVPHGLITTQVNFDGANFYNTTLGGNFEKFSGRGSSFDNVNLNNINLHGVFTDATFKDVSLYGNIRLSGDFRNTTFTVKRDNMALIDISEADFSGSRWPGQKTPCMEGSKGLCRISSDVILNAYNLPATGNISFLSRRLAQNDVSVPSCSTNDVQNMNELFESQDYRVLESLIADTVDKGLKVGPELRDRTIPPDELRAITVYTMAPINRIYKDVNLSLRTGKEVPQRFSGFINCLNYGLSRLSSYRGETYRGLANLDKSALAKIRTDYAVGKIVTEKAYTSTSLDPAVPLEYKGIVVFIYRADPNSQRKFVMDLSFKADDLEALFPPSTNHKVVDQFIGISRDEKGNIIPVEYIELQEIAP